MQEYEYIFQSGIQCLCAIYLEKFCHLALGVSDLNGSRLYKYFKVAYSILFPFLGCAYSKWCWVQWIIWYSVDPNPTFLYC